MATVSAVLTVGSSIDREGIACRKKAAAIEIGGRAPDDVGTCSSRLRLAIGQGWLTLTQYDLGMAINHGGCEATGREFDPNEWQ